MQVKAKKVTKQKDSNTNCNTNYSYINRNISGICS